MHYPVIYNDIHNWHFVYQMKTPVMFFLRPHWNILSDISNDWSDPGAHASPVVAIHDFLPTVYKHEIVADALSLHLNINEKNVIDRLYNFDFNNYVTFKVPYLNATINNVGGIKYRAEKTEVSFSVQLGHTANDVNNGNANPDENHYFMHSAMMGMVTVEE